MRPTAALCLLALPAALAADAASARRELDRVLRPRIEALAAFYNNSYTVAVHQSSFAEPWVFTTGLDDRATGSPMTVDRLIPQGSVTKPFLVATMLKLQEQGVWDLDEPAYRYVDPFLYKHNGTTMLELWKDPRINNVTLRQLCGMQSGIYDYDDTELTNFFKTHPHFDVSPFDMLHAVNKSFWFSPGEGTSYTTTGFNVLGLALCTVFKLDRWEDLDQKWIFPAGGYAGIEFSKPGPCTQFPNMAHQYMGGAEWPEFVDIIDYSCLNSWAGGNIAATAQDIARWWVDLLGSPSAVLSPESVRQMTRTHKFTDYFQVGRYYAFGLEVLDWGANNKVGYHLNDSGILFGHGGGDYGSGGYGGFSFEYNFSFHFQTNSYVAQNLSLSEKSNMASRGYTMCNVFSDVLQIMSNKVAPALPCTKLPMPSEGLLDRDPIVI